jgi:lambda family phage portal protein
VLLRFKDFDEFEDATLMKQKVAACLAAFITDPDGSMEPLGVAKPGGTEPNTPELDALGPGALINLPAGRSVEMVEPPTASDYEPYSRTVLRAIATGLGVTYEDLTGDYANMPFSAARMSRLRHEARIHDWRWRILVPQFCAPVWNWFMQAAVIANQVPETALEMRAQWTPPPLPMVDPTSEGRAAMQLIRSGISSWSEEVRARGFDPEELAKEIAADNARFDRLGIIIDSDPRKMTQAGQAQPAEEPDASAEALAAEAKTKEAADRRMRAIAGGR